MREIIEIVVTPEGKTTVQTKGFVGTACRVASRFLEQALGEQSAERMTAEYYQTETASQRLRERP